MIRLLLPARSALAALITVAFLFGGCAHRGSRTAGPVVGLYSAEFVEEGHARRFRTWVWAASPDRLHIEVLSGIGTTVLILDSGGGRLAVAVPRDRLAWAGPATPEVVGRVTGFEVELEDLVRTILVGDSILGVAVARHGSASGELPRRLELAAGSRVLRLELKRLRPLGSAPGSIGRGEPPAGFEVEPIDELAIEGWSLP